MAKAKTKQDVMQETLDRIRKNYGDKAIMFLGENPEPVECVSTGIPQIDYALGVGGLPKGRIVEFYGPEGGGKTTIALHALAQAQKEGQAVAFIDAEHALDPVLAGKIGIDTNSLLVAQPDSGESALGMVRDLVRSGVLGLIVVDSVAALTPRAEIDGEIGDMTVGLQARLMSSSLRQLTSVISQTQTTVIFINQLRSTIQRGYGHGPSETTPGGRALKFYSSVRLEIKRGKAVTRQEEAIGHELWIKVVKNKVAPPFRTARATLIYGEGVPYESSLYDMAVDEGIIGKKGSWLTYRGETIGQGRDNALNYMKENPSLMEEIRLALDEKMKRNSGSGIEGPCPAEGNKGDEADRTDEALPFEEGDTEEAR